MSAWIVEIPNTQHIIDATRLWTSTIVIGLNLCPFAQRVFQGELIRYAVTDAADAEALRVALTDELKLLAAAPIDEIETTMLIHPDALNRFSDYCDFLPELQRILKLQGLIRIVQVANFHPQFQFANTDPLAAENYTNRSPYPMLHLLREASISKAAAGSNDLLEIPRRNAAALQRMGRAQIERMLESIAVSPKERIDAL